MQHDLEKTLRRSSKPTRIGRFAVSLSAVALSASACISPDSPILEESAQGCDEFQTGATIDRNLKVDHKVRVFMQAASDFAASADRIQASVIDSCSKVALDLGAQDSWSAIDDPEDRLSNASRTGACDVAAAQIEEVMIEAGRVNAKVSVLVSKGECHLDFAEQAACDAECEANAKCDPGKCETRCEPGALSVQCHANCQAGAVCVGLPERPANCMGECESTCVGKCHGTCTFKDGRRSENDANCNGKCSSSCNGMCRGRCKLEAPEGVNCGASVRCTGGCSASFSDPVCTTEFTPPSCTVDVDCHAACSARVAAHAVCEPTQVEVFVDVRATPRLQPLVDTLQKNLPALIDAAEKEGELAMNAAHRLGEVGEKLSHQIEDLDGKSLACLGKASSAVGEAVSSFDVSVQASIDVTVKTHAAR